MKKWLIAVVMLGLVSPAFGYPIDGYEYSGIRRLEYVKKVVNDEIKGTKPAIGARLPMDSIHLSLAGTTAFDSKRLPAPDPTFQKRIEALFPSRHESYALAIMDISEGQPLRYAAYQSERSYQPGSVGKIAVAAGLFTELARLYPNSIEKRHELLKNRVVVADRWIHSDHHDVPVFDPKSNSYEARDLQDGDRFTLYEWIDHAMSASANAAAAVVWKEVMLMRAFGANYPPSREDELAYFKNIPKTELAKVSLSVVNDPLRAIGIAEADWQLGSFFTATGKSIVPGSRSYANPKALMQYLVAMEQGKLVDEWSSLEIKRLMYMTAKRIRYASSPALSRSAVYFKSGSLYKCVPEAGFTCKQYHGNVENYMNSVAIVEHENGRRYLITLMSNVLRKNSAVDHQTLATEIDRLLTSE